MIKKSVFFRLSIVIVFFFTLFLIVLVRLFYWQIIRGEELKNIGLSQSTDSLVISSKRGDIFSADNYPIATNKTSYLLYSNPRVLSEKDLVAKKLSLILEIPEASISAQLSKQLFWVKLDNSIPAEKKTVVEDLKIPGIGFQQQSERFYPEASMAAHLVGFVGKDTNGQDKGYFGIEGFYNDLLSGRPGKIYVVRDALGNKIVNDLREEKKIDGRSVVLSIDRTIQFIAQKRLKDSIEKYGADGGSAIAMETKTGKILAMSSFPSFDTQKYYNFDSETYINPAISELYEPGSTFKTLIMAAGIDAGVVKPDTKCDICSGPVSIGEYSIKTWNNKYFGNITMTDVIEHSDNTGMVFVGRKLGVKNLLSYLSRFGIGERTGIDLQGEVTSVLRSEKKWYPIDLATATFGQGISLTPLQLINGVNAIANGGELMKPYIVTKIITEEGRIIEIKPQVLRKAVSRAAAKVMSLLMVNAVENGEAKWTKLKDYKVAGKTGTAQIPLAGHYDSTQTIASFVGFFPAEDPRVTMLVLIKRPKTSIYGAETAAPIFFSIARDILNYYNIAPTR
ncbi:MAG: hypothetical protein COX79_03065 [Candidatus Levybacteria bacterium CG_4_10_14_0_2_um_filter_36_16]|nr:MAG: hypothetical protein AUK12_00880 [Candidatus Levybacteria bacterium CG2_30_37_29]PIR79076.1 MAG: hypothetical protein COU26_03130 [Candidatus Levybacteria bacterium CG10_big_fil_rev_8_21_14_0_10_36_30]PIZ97218.1 MAG: hypothetical protein COX79_03065 [Candidatus Levybacteria bacterium CG_4_10_14_0_2_um_filter_36_16]PJA90685.1 MAG: hypothetical protein CO136_01240 [Candidatus Levybacteria bacterium CG_4_9_14_3_um_filter_36_7]